MKVGIKDILKRSYPARCGVTEKEVRVPKRLVSRRIVQLKDAGFHVIGTSHGNTPTKKIWFIRGGGL